MARVTRSVASRKRRKKILKLAKGYRGRSNNVYSIAVRAVEKGLQYAYRDRKVKKRTFRGLWIQRINAAIRELDPTVTYSKFMHLLKTHDISLNRKVLANMAESQPDAFKAIALKVISK